MYFSWLSASNHPLQKAGQWMGNRGKFVDESSVEVAKSDEDLDVSKGLWLWPLCNGLNPFRFHGDSLLRYFVSKKADMISVKFAFAGFAVQLCSTQSFEDLLDVFRMGFAVLGKDEDVVKVGHTEFIE